MSRKERSDTKDAYTGTRPVCYRKFSDCECGYLVSGWFGDKMPQEPTEREELKDIIYTLKRHCEITQLIMEQGEDHLLPTSLEDIYYHAQDLPEYFIKRDSPKSLSDSAGLYRIKICPSKGLISANGEMIHNWVETKFFDSKGDAEEYCKTIFLQVSVMKEL